MITMMGAHRSGKTSFLVALYYEIIERQDANHAWSMEALNDRARQLVLEGYQRFTNGEFPRTTEPQIGQAMEPLRYRLTRPVEGFKGRLWRGGMSHEAIDLDMLDPSGEYFSTPELLLAQNQEAATFRESLINSTGILCIIDPDRADGNDYFTLLFKNFTQLSTLMNGDGGGRIDVPVAICLAKADQHLAAFDEPRDYLRNLMGRSAFSVLLTYCSTMKFFATSAVGRDNVERLEDGTYRPKGEPRPENVLTPVDWLLENQP